MKQTIIRTLNLILIIGVLFTYQQYALDRDQEVSAHKVEEKKAKALERKYQKMIEEAASENVTPKYKDGVYEGSGKGYGGDIKLSLTIKDGDISKVDFISADGEDQVYLNLASQLLDQFVEEQSVDLDVISGASYSSKGILEAAKKAIEGAENE